MRVRVAARTAAHAVALGLAAGLALASSAASAAQYVSTSDPATILYDAPSDRARPLFVYGRGVPVEQLVAVEGWTKVRDAGGTIGWIATPSLSAKRMVEVRVPVADVRERPDDGAPIAFRAAQDVLLALDETAASPATVANPGWARVRDRDGRVGYVKLAAIFGF
ncbi:MAG: hypothetical protein JSS46_16075 [Proteobacteria bacterium]|jgi:SH3-like domain-containing protein|nr:hypothetical protein [Pseudomonadota bacterium]